MKILIVEDDIRIAVPVADDLRRQNHVVQIAADGRAGLDYARTGAYDILLLDVMLPNLDGLQICRQLRTEGADVKILMLTARDTVDDKVHALDAGADDYIVKPFELAELSARIRAVSRRGDNAHATLIRKGKLSLDPRAARVTYDENPATLTRTEFAILETLMRHDTQIFSRAMLQDKITALDTDSSSDTIKTHLTNLRKKIRAAGCPKDPIETVYGTGYRIADDI